MLDAPRSGISLAPSIRRACDACKRRKVRCDAASSPCANCTISQIQCSYNVAPRRRGPKRRTLPQQASPATQDHVDSGQYGPSVIPVNDYDDGHEVNMAASPPTTSLTSQSVISVSRSPTQAVQNELQKGLATAIPRQSLDAIANRCITLYMKYLFPVAPIVHEQSIRSSLHLLEIQFEHEPSSPNSWLTSTYADYSQIRKWTLLTALCAATAYLLPSTLFPERDLLSHLFLRASRDMLKIYQDLDIEHPDYSSLAIRYYHSNALHAVGKTRVSWHVLGEAVRLAQEMRLFDEQSFRNVDPLEAHLRRSIFWQICTADKSAAILNDRPIALHEICSGEPVTTLYPSSAYLPLGSWVPSQSTELMERYVATGFDLCQDLWMRASDLILRLDAIKLLRVSTDDAAILQNVQESISQDHLRFISTLDNIHLDAVSVDPNRVQDGCTPAQFDRVKAIQRTNLLVTFHCLRLVLLQKFVETGLATLLGIREDALALALRKTEIASDMVRALSECPFESLQINGEPCVEKIRRVGVTLLEIVHEVNSPALVERAKSLFLILLDVLARLDSRVSEELSINRGF